MKDEPAKDTTSAGEGAEKSAREEEPEGEEALGEELQVKIRDAEKLAEEYRELLLRCRADFENYKKHVSRQQEKFVKFANRELIMELIDVWENLERGLELKGDNGDFRAGIELVASQLWKLLEKEGLEPIKAEGEKFDPTLHEAMLQTPSENEEGVVLEELQRGYTLKGEVLRYSKVRVSKKPDAESDTSYSEVQVSDSHPTENGKSGKNKDKNK